MNGVLLNSVISGGPNSEMVCNGSCYNCYAGRKFRKVGLNIYCQIKLVVNIGKCKCSYLKTKQTNKNKKTPLYLFYF